MDGGGLEKVVMAVVVVVVVDEVKWKGDNIIVVMEVG